MAMRRASAAPRSGSPTVSTIITVPSALISGLMECRSIAKICVGTVSTPPGFQNSVPVMSSNEMVKANSAPAATAGMSSGSVIEVVCYLDARNMEKGRVVPTSPEDDYTVVLYCHGCGRAAALDLSREEQGRDAA